MDPHEEAENEDAEANANEPMPKKQRSDDAEEKPATVHYDVLFRSFVPKDVKLATCKRPQQEVPDMVAEIAARVQALANRKYDDVLSLAPKKAAWDLARDLEPRLAQLERKTDRAIVEYLQESKQ